MYEDWNNKDIVGSWSAANGGETWPYGDLWRMCLVNPVALQYAQAIRDGHFDPKIVAPINDAINHQASYARARDYDNAALLDWHEREAPADLSGLRALDLGAGEGYIGRWLATMGAEYAGYDGSKGLVQVGVERAKKSKTTQNVSMDSVDLSSPTSLLAKLKKKYTDAADGEFPDIVFSIICFDHIQSPYATLRGLADWLGKADKHVPFIIWTLNPYYFLEKVELPPAGLVGGVDADNRAAGIFGEIDAQETTIASSASKVRVYFRDSRHWEMLFHQAGFRVLQTTQLQFPDPSAVKMFLRAADAPADVLESVFHGAAPFQCWVLLPQKRGKPITKAFLKETLLNNPTYLLSKMGKREKNLLCTAHKDLEAIDFAAGERIYFDGCLGEDPLVVTGGDIKVVSDKLVRQDFPAGALLGDLETGRNYLTSRYIYPVDAGKSGCSAIRIPTPLFRSMSSRSADEKTFGGMLFEQLRDRLTGHSWTYFEQNARGGKLAIKTSPKLNDSPLVMAARALLFAATLEADTEHRVPDASTIFVGEDELNRLVNRPGGERLATALRFLTSIQVLEAFPGRHLFVDADDNPISMLWSNVCSLIGERFLIQPLIEQGVLPESERTYIPSIASGAFLGTYNKGLYGKDHALSPHGQSFAEDLRRELRVRCQAASDASLRKTILRYLSNIVFIQEHFFMSKSPSFFQINEPRLLRSIAFNSAGWQDDLQAITSARIGSGTIDIRSWSDLAKNFPDRSSRYLDTIGTFFENALGSDSASNDLHFSGHEYLDIDGHISSATDYPWLNDPTF